MRFLKLTPLTSDFLPEIVRLDQACFGGLWSSAAYQREISSPNSVLVGLVDTGDHDSVGHMPVLDYAPRDSIAAAHAPAANALAHAGVNSPCKLLAMGCLWAICEEAHITLLAVHESCRRQGMGRALLGSLLRQATQRGLEWATLEVRVSNAAALNIYSTFGFTTVGRRQRYYGDTGEDALVLWRNGLQESDFGPLVDQVMAQAIAQLQNHGWSIQFQDFCPGA